MAEIEQILLVESYGKAIVLEAQLEEAGIPYVLQAFNDPAFGSFWRRKEGWGIVLAPVEFRERIEQIYADLPAEE